MAISNETEAARQGYLYQLGEIIRETELTPEMATQLCFAEIASWLMVISDQLGEVQVEVCPTCANLYHGGY